MKTKSKPVKAWGLKWKNKISDISFHKKDFMGWPDNPNYRIVRVEIREVVK